MIGTGIFQFRKRLLHNLHRQRRSRSCENEGISPYVITFGVVKEMLPALDEVVDIDGSSLFSFKIYMGDSDSTIEFLSISNANLGHFDDFNTLVYDLKRTI